MVLISDCGFRPGKPKIDPIFTLRRIWEKTPGKEIATHHLFVDWHTCETNKRGFIQDEALSCDFFNITMERIICAADLRHSGTIFYKRVMPVATADDVDIIGRSDREVAVAFSKRGVFV